MSPLTSRLFHGEWDDIFGTFAQGSGTGALTYEQYRNTVRSLYHFRHDQNDIIYQEYQSSHMQMLNASVIFHAHVIPLATWVPGDPTKNVYWEVKYFWAEINAEIPVDASWPTAVNIATPFAPTDQFKHKMVNLATIPMPAANTVSAFLLVRVTRLGTDPLDTYNVDKVGGTVAANLALLGFDLHYQKNRPGSINSGG